MSRGFFINILDHVANVDGSRHRGVRCFCFIVVMIIKNGTPLVERGPRRLD